jgi:hypothetical protein
MDPYLEGPLWPTVHTSLVNEIAHQLAPKLRPKYFALPQQRIVVTVPDPLEMRAQSRFPDVGVYLPESTSSPSKPAATAAPLVLDALLPENIPESYVEIRDVEQRRLVTAIEVLSPSNKRGPAAEQHRKKRDEFLASEVHYLEIDLLRVGERFPLTGPLPSVPYFVFLSRAACRPRVEIWPIPLQQPLPTVPVPLLSDDPDVPLDLQAALQTIYDWYDYERAADHAGRPPLPLSAEQQAWADERLRAAGILS